ncbi:sporulation protein YabP [Salsuginibacillus kocurii]|uniref:sporulation protein YabP n=1 Tax=Salsuginibacillus kocurii TaxID=427078 RepID=UPI0003655562|nr:sporulation protein YabP [Salsuginibacillus kocurii]
MDYRPEFNKSKIEREHDVVLKGRNRMEITGVKEIEHFDSQEFLIETVLGYLSVRGADLHMKNVDVETGLVSLEGKVDDLIYMDTPSGGEKKSWIGKWLK